MTFVEIVATKKLASTNSSNCVTDGVMYRNAMERKWWVKFLTSPLFYQFCCLCAPCAQIGVILRDSNGIAQVRAITGSKILRVLKSNGRLRAIAPMLFVVPVYTIMSNLNLYDTIYFGLRLGSYRFFGHKEFSQP